MIICVQMMPELRRYIQHISLSPDSINNDDVSTLPLFSFVAALAAGRETKRLKTVIQQQNVYLKKKSQKPKVGSFFMFFFFTLNQRSASSPFLCWLF